MMEYGTIDASTTLNSAEVGQSGNTRNTMEHSTSRWLVGSIPEGIMLISVVLNSMAAGVIFIFSNTIMPVLATLEAKEGIMIMNTINDIILNPLFGVVFFGGLVSAFPAFRMWKNPGEYSIPARYYGVATTVVFFFGNFMVTGTQNVPMNNELLAVDPGSDEGAAYWEDTYLTNWVAWNTARGIFATLAALLGALCLRFMAKGKA